MTLRDWWTLARGPLLLATFMGCVVSLAASGRISARLVVDGALSFAFVPIVEAAAFAVVYRRGARPIPFAPAMDRFFGTNAPWLAIMTALALLTVAQTPQQTGTWIVPPKVWVVESAAALGIVWSMCLDVAFLQATLGRSRAAAIADALVLRAIAWTLVTVYFFGYAIPPMVVAWSRGW